jgi:general stress protein YciG
MAKGRQGFASMTKERQRQIASLGGQAAHRGGGAHEWTHEEAITAGRRGGLACWRRRKAEAEPKDREA